MMATALPANAHEVRDVLKTMKQNLKCPICLETLSSPYNTQCGHSYCKECICTAIKQSKAPKCPLCKEQITKRSLRENVRLCEIVAAVGVLEQAIIEDTGITDTPPRPVPHNTKTTGTPGVILHSKLHPTPMKHETTDQNTPHPPPHKDKENDDRRSRVCIDEQQQPSTSHTMLTRAMSSSKTQKKRKLFVDAGTSQSQSKNSPTSSSAAPIIHEVTIPITSQSMNSSPPRKKTTRQTSLPRHSNNKSTHNTRRKERVNGEMVLRKEEVNNEDDNDMALLTALEKASLRQTPDTIVNSDPVAIATDGKQSPTKKPVSCSINEDDSRHGDDFIDIIEEVPIINGRITNSKQLYDKSIIEDAPVIIDNNKDLYLSPCIPQQNDNTMHHRMKNIADDSIVCSSQYTLSQRGSGALPGLLDHAQLTPPTMTSPLLDHAQLTPPTMISSVLDHAQPTSNESPHDHLLATNTSPHSQLSSSNESTPSISPTALLIQKNIKTPPLSRKALPIIQPILPDNHPFLSVSSPSLSSYNTHTTILDF